MFNTYFADKHGCLNNETQQNNMNFRDGFRFSFFNLSLMNCRSL